MRFSPRADGTPRSGAAASRPPRHRGSTAVERSSAPDETASTKRVAPSTLVVATPVARPPWVNVEGFHTANWAMERRKMNPLLDINAFGSSMRRTRRLDVKGQLGSGPLQEWKEMLRGETVEKELDREWKVPSYEAWQGSMPPRPRLDQGRRMGAPPESPLMSRSSPLRAMRSTSSGSLAGGQLQLQQHPSAAAAAAVAAAVAARQGGGGFSFWGGKSADVASGFVAAATITAPTPANAKLSSRPPSAATTQDAGQARGPPRPKSAPSAAPRRKQPVKTWGPDGERKLSIKARPAWRNVTGPMGDDTLLTEHRKLNPHCDINSFAASTAFRPLDTKGQRGARPVQMWKEMLRT